MKYFLLSLVILFFVGCDNTNETTAIPTAETTYPSIITQKISDSLIEQLDQSKIIDSLEIMNFNIGNFNKNEVFEISDSLSIDGWRVITKKELNFFYKKKIIKPGKYWCWDNNFSDVVDTEIGVFKDDNDFISNMEDESGNPDDKICSLRLIRNYRDIKTELYNNEQKEPINHLKFSKGENSTKIMSLEVMNNDLDILYTYDEAEKEVSRLKLRIPSFSEIKLMYKYRNLIGGFNTSRDNRNYYWTTATDRITNHHVAMDFSMDKDLDENKISYALLDVSMMSSYSIRPVK